jgi:glycosyltransferase involved in cell wall biosynthesis
MTPARVLHLSAGNMYGGVETFLTALARLRHHAPAVAPEFGLCFPGRQWDELTAADVPVHDLGAVRLSRPWTVFQARRRLAGVLTDRGFRAVVCHGCWAHSAFAPVVRANGARLVTWVHGVLTGKPLVERLAPRTRPDLVVASSAFAAAAVGGVFPGVPAAMVRYPIQPAGVPDPVGVRRAVRAELGTPDDAVVILTACRLEPWKGHTLLLEALGRLRDRPGWAAWVAGGPQLPPEATYLNELRATAARLGVADRVRFVGQRADVPRLLAAADLHCQPNAGPEPFGLAFVEALAAGLPVVTTAMGGALEIVTPACGVLTPPGDASGLADALGELMADAGRRAALGAAGPGRAAELCDPARQVARVAGAVLGGAG